MAGTSLNDIVTAYAAANADEATYNAGKALLQDAYTFDQIMAAGAGTYNDGLKALADTPTAPTVTTTTLNALKDTVAFSQQLTATGNPVPTWSVTAGTIVSGLSLSSAGLLSGAPDTAGAYDFTVTATNSEGSDTQQYTGSVAVFVAPTITTTTLDSLSEDTAFSQTLVATGDTPITWAVTAGTIVPGLSLSSAGVLSGTPTTAGAYDFTVTATNAGGSDPQQYTGTVAAAPVAPTVTTTTLDAMTVDSAFSQVLAADGDTPITWAVTTGSVPAGLSLSSGGTLSGTPTTEGAYSFTVTATNAAGSDDQAYSGSVAAAPEPSSSYFTGGDQVFEYDGNRIHVFGTSGTLTLVGDGSVDVDYLVVGGGGSGGRGTNTSLGHGGGGGGVVSSGTTSLSGNVSITIGAGGADLTSAGPGNDGGSTVFGAVVTALGGGGGGGGSTLVATAGRSAGTGGGAAGFDSTRTGAAGTGSPGFDGGEGYFSATSSERNGGGGGSSAAAGSDGTISQAGAGAVGVPSTIRNTKIWYGPGGGGSGVGTFVSARDGGGLANLKNAANVSQGTHGTGAGGPGGVTNKQGGGNGIVVVSYPYTRTGSNFSWPDTVGTTAQYVAEIATWGSSGSASATRSAMNEPAGSGYPSNDTNSSCLGPDGRIYCPAAGGNIQVLDPASGQSFISNFGYSGSSSGSSYGAVYAPNGKIYFIPYDCDELLILDTTTGILTGTNDSGNIDSSSQKWYGGVYSPVSNKVYCANWINGGKARSGAGAGVGAIMAIDCSDDSISYIDDSGSNLSGMRGATLGSDGLVYFGPGSRTDFVVLDPSDDSITITDFGTTFTNTGSSWTGIHTGPDDKLYVTPSEATTILVVDVDAQTLTETDLGTTLPSGVNKWWSGSLGSDGRIYCAPRSQASTPRFLIIDCNTGSVTLSDLGADLSPATSDNGWGSGTLATDGKIYYPQWDASDILIVDCNGDGDTDLNILLHPALNHY